MKDNYKKKQDASSEENSREKAGNFKEDAANGNVHVLEICRYGIDISSVEQKKQKRNQHKVSKAKQNNKQKKPIQHHNAVVKMKTTHAECSKIEKQNVGRMILAYKH